MVDQPEDRKSLGLARLKFTPAQIERMRQAKADGQSLADIGLRFGCSSSVVGRLIRKEVKP
jgi:hypothetical protein